MLPRTGTSLFSSLNTALQQKYAASAQSAAGRLLTGFSRFDVVFDQILEGAAAALGKEADPVILAKIRVDIAGHDITSTVNEDLDGVDVQEYMKINAVLLADRADSLIDILLTAAERNSALTSVEDDLSRLFVVIDKRLMFLSAEEFDAGLLSGSKLQSDRKLRACSAHSLYGEFAVRDRDRSGSDLIASVILNLTDRPLDKLSILDTQFARKYVGTGRPIPLPG